MTTYDGVLNQLRKCKEWNYGDRSSASSEAAALCSLALIGEDQLEDAQASADWLSDIQSKSGGVPIDGNPGSPQWSTGLAILAWHRWNQAAATSKYSINIERAMSWLLKNEGTTIPPDEAKHIGHDTTLIGWPWVIGTHSWIEPTAMSALALRTMELSDHLRVTDAIELLCDRQLPQGGCNYGNTFILGQRLRPHVQPTGWAMLALRHAVSPEKTKNSLAFLRRSYSSPLSLASTAFATLGLHAHQDPSFAFVTESRQKLLDAFHRTQNRKADAYQLSLFAHAYQGNESLLLIGK